MVGSKRIWGSVSIFLLMLAVLVIVANWQNEGARFNQTLLDANARIGRAGQQFGDTMQRSLQKDKPDLDEIAAAYKKLQDEFRQVSERMNTIEVPDLPLANELYLAHQQFLKGQESLIEVDMREMAEVMKIESLAKDQRRSKLKEIAKRIRVRHDSDVAAFEDRQKDFADRNGFRLKKPQAPGRASNVAEIR